jgi:hypothetical protein
MILVEGYSTKYFSNKGEGSRVIIDKISFYDLSYCSGVLFLGHNSSVFQKNIFYPRNGVILLSLANNMKDFNCIIDNVSIGMKKNFS